MKVVHVEELIRLGEIAKSEFWKTLHDDLIKLICEVDWPIGSGQFLIYPESGKKTGQGNGVKVIKNSLMTKLASLSWVLECPLDIATLRSPGAIDAVLETPYGKVAFEWETGNISSSHRALNKLSVGLIKGVISAGILVVPSRKLYQYLTDRVGNYEELTPYLELWKNIKCSSGILEIIVIEQDGTSTDVPRIPKGTDGRARI
jgi:hypothetical protein